jgi:hypothetical protein
VKRTLITISAAVLAAVPATVGLSGNDSFAQSVPVRTPSQVTVAPAKGGPAKHAQPGDDKGRHGKHAEPADDKGGRPVAAVARSANDTAAVSTPSPGTTRAGQSGDDCPTQS